MAKPEQRVIDYFKKSLKIFAKNAGYTLHIDKLPASGFNTGGRPDLFIDLGPYHFRCEMKADRGKLSALQELYINERAVQMPLTCHVIVGKKGVDLFMKNLHQLLQDYNEWASQIT